MGWLASLPEGGTKGQAIEPEVAAPQDVCERYIRSSSQTFLSLRGEPPSAQRGGFLSKNVVCQFTKMKTWFRF